MSRVDRIVIRITPEMKDEFIKIAEGYGLTMSGLGGYVLGKFIDDKRAEEKLRLEAIKSLMPSMDQLVDKVTKENVELLNRP